MAIVFATQCPSYYNMNVRKCFCIAKLILCVLCNVYKNIYDFEQKNKKREALKAAVASMWWSSVLGWISQ